MPHIHTDVGNYDQTASAFILRLDGDEPRLLLHRHKKLKFYLQFGGHIEVNENPWQTVSRELREEIGYAFDQLKVLQPSVSPPKFEGKYTVIHPQPMAIASHPFDLTLIHFHTDTCWVFVTDQEPSLKAGIDESRDITAFTKSQLQLIPDGEIFDNIRVLGLYAIETCLPEWIGINANEFRL
jgi:8-oxo-dGTP pyrophosphatase MutT (NUDIX family)